MLAETTRGLSTEPSSMLLIVHLYLPPHKHRPGQDIASCTMEFITNDKSSHHLFRLLTLLIVIFMLPMSSLDVQIDSNMHRIIHAPNHYGHVEVSVIREVSWSLS